MEESSVSHQKYHVCRLGKNADFWAVAGGILMALKIPAFFREKRLSGGFCLFVCLFLSRTLL